MFTAELSTVLSCKRRPVTEVERRQRQW